MDDLAVLKSLAWLHQEYLKRATDTYARFIEKSRYCVHRHPTALYSNCLHPAGDSDMANCLIDECPLKKEAIEMEVHLTCQGS